MSNENYFLNYTKVSSIYVLALAAVMVIGFYFQSQNGAYFQSASLELSEKLKVMTQANKALEIENKALKSSNLRYQMQNERNMCLMQRVHYSYGDTIYTLENEDCPGPLYKKLEDYNKLNNEICSVLYESTGSK